MKNGLRILVILLFVGPALVGCTSLSYLAQSADGHLQMLGKRQNVEKLAADPKQPEALRSQMVLARDIRQFATDELALPDNKSYKSYVDVGRDYVTVAVFAAPEFSLVPQTWCFPIFGCVPYRAYFSVDAALKQRDALAAQGFDTHLSPITAYSTLGWTSDPLLNTMFRDNETHLASVVFHELAHQKVYIQDDSAFNEAFAVAVERTGVQQWLRSRGETDVLANYMKSNRRSAQFLALIDKTRRELNDIYASAADDAQKRVAKKAAVDRLGVRYKHMRDRQWGGYAGYDGWLDGEINNAKIAATAVYSDLVPDFLKLFKACGSDYPRFYKAVEQLGKITKDKRLNALKAGACE